MGFVDKPKHWREFQAENSWKAAPNIEFDAVAWRVMR